MKILVILSLTWKGNFWDFTKSITIPDKLAIISHMTAHLIPKIAIKFAELLFISIDKSTNQEWFRYSLSTTCLSLPLKVNE